MMSLESWKMASNGAGDDGSVLKFTRSPLVHRELEAI
jgi:hypothetical protein